MKYPVTGLVALLLGALLPGCGGGGDSAPATPGTPLPASTKVTLAAGNYQDAAVRAMSASNAAYAYARMAITVVDDLLNVPLGALPIFTCPGGGLRSIELLDQNKDTSLDPGDTAHLRWDHCKQNGLTTTGVVHLELTNATQITGGRDYQITLTVANLEMVPDAAGVPTITANLILPVHYTRTATTDHVVIDGAVFTSGQIAGDSGTATLYVDYLQDRSVQTYSLSTRGTVNSSVLGGNIDFTTPLAFTGVIGEYPSAGNLSITGNANSVVRLAEEGSAASDPATVLVTVDANGDGTLEASNSLAWTTVVPAQLFDTFVGQVGLPVPIP